MYFTEIGYKLGQKQVRGDGVTQLCELLEKLESMFLFHFCCEHKKLQDTGFQLLKINYEQYGMENEDCLITVGFTKLIFYQDYIEILTPML